MPKSEKEDNSANRILPTVNQVIYTLDIICKPDILLTRLPYYTKCQSRRKEIIQPNIYRILPKVNQVIYMLDTVYMPNIMILAHGLIRPEIKLVRAFMPVLVTSNFDDDSIKKRRAIMKTPL